MKDQCAWQLEQGRELSTLKERIDMTQEIEVANCVLDGQTAMGLVGLDRHVELLEKQGRFLLDRQEQDSNVWHNVAFNLREEVQEGEEKMTTLQDLLDVQRSQTNSFASLKLRLIERWLLLSRLLIRRRRRGRQ